MGTIFSAGVINFTGTILGLAGILFNAIVKYTIVDFHSIVYQPLQTGIATAWTFFRDLSNIVIIGMFTFIAIQKIIGVEVVGTNKMIARVLIIAILINFSLFFTNAVIGASNFIARQFYHAALAASADSTLRGDASLDEFVTRKGISGQFIQLTGLPSAFKARDTVSAIAENPSGGGWKALAYGAVVSILIIGVTILLLYASFLLFVRTILFILLLVSSSLAFALYLIPSERTPFHAWWKSLLRNAVLGPLLLISIWVTLSLGNAFAGNQPGGLANLFSNPNDPSGFTALFSFLLMLGLLYASIHLSHQFSNHIGGFSYGSFATKLAGGLSFMMGSQIAGFGLRHSVGRAASLQSADMERQMSRIRKELRPNSGASEAQRSALQGRLDMLNKQLPSMQKLARSEFDASKTKIVQDAMKAAGLPKAMTNSKSLGGFDGRAEKLAKEIANRAKTATKLTDGDTEAIRSDAREREAAKIRTEKETAQMQKEAAQTALQAAQASKQAAEEQHTAAMKSFETTKRSAENQQRMIETTIKQLERDKEYIPEGTDGRRRQQEEIHRHQSALNEEKERITRAHESVKGFEKAVADATRESEEHRAALEKFSKVIEENNDTEKVAKRIASAAEADVRESRSHLENEAAQMAQRLIGREVGRSMQTLVADKSLAELRKGLKAEKTSISGILGSDSNPQNQKYIGGQGR